MCKSTCTSRSILVGDAVASTVDGKVNKGESYKQTISSSTAISREKVVVDPATVTAKRNSIMAGSSYLPSSSLSNLDHVAVNTIKKSSTRKKSKEEEEAIASPLSSSILNRKHGRVFQRRGSTRGAKKSSTMTPESIAGNKKSSSFTDHKPRIFQRRGSTGNTKMKSSMASNSSSSLQFDDTTTAAGNNAYTSNNMSRKIFQRRGSHTETNATTTGRRTSVLQRRGSTGSAGIVIEQQYSSHATTKKKNKSSSSRYIRKSSTRTPMTAASTVIAMTTVLQDNVHEEKPMSYCNDHSYDRDMGIFVYTRNTWLDNESVSSLDISERTSWVRGDNSTSLCLNNTGIISREERGSKNNSSGNNSNGIPIHHEIINDRNAIRSSRRRASLSGIQVPWPTTSSKDDDDATNGNDNCDANMKGVGKKTRSRSSSNNAAAAAATFLVDDDLMAERKIYERLKSR